MIFEDRQGENLNRKKIKIISQTPTEIVADIERADTATVEGTPITASVFNAFQEEINTASENATTAINFSDTALANANSALTKANEAKATAERVNTAFNDLKDTSEFLNINFSSEIATWAHSDVNSLPTMFGIKAEQTSNVKFFGDSTIKANVVIDGDFYGSNGQKKVLYKSELLDSIYPVGSIYMNVNSTSPASLFGGTWSQLKDRFLLGTGDIYGNGNTGGEATHTLTVEEMPRHSHVENFTDYNGSSNSYIAKIGGTTSGINYEGSWRNDLTGGQVNTDYSGNSCPHNNMPPYLVVNMWKRIG